MNFSVTPTSIPASWKRTLTDQPIKPIHFVSVILFNGLCLLALAKTLRILLTVRKTDPGLLLFFAFILFFLVMAALSIWQVYRHARAEVQVRENPSALLISYLALRLYLCVLGVAIMLLFTINLMHG